MRSKIDETGEIAFKVDVAKARQGGTEEHQPCTVMTGVDWGIGAGELAAGVDMIIGSAWSPALLSMAVSLSFGLRSLLLCWDISRVSLDSSPLSCMRRSLPCQDGTSQTIPVKLFSWKALFCHLRQGFPDRSRARRPALIAPWLALGPNLWPVIPAPIAGDGLLVP